MDVDINLYDSFLLVSDVSYASEYPSFNNVINAIML